MKQGFPSIPRFDAEAFRAWCKNTAHPWFGRYCAMYSSWFGGIATDPHLMLIPVDDHMVHRGDGLFETMRCDDGAVYRLDAHFDRLFAGAERVRMPIPWSRAEMTDIMRQVLAAGGKRDALIRLFVSRGPGGHTANPAECEGPQLWILAIRRGPNFMDAHPEGARVVPSGIPAKSGFFPRVKSVNYLPNALMFMEASAAGADFALGFDAEGFMAELPTENAGIVTRDGVLCVPRPEHVLRGTTMARALELAREELVPAGVLRGVEERDVARAEVDAAAELLVFGTTPIVTAGVEWDGRPVGAGRPGPVWRALHAAMRRDMRDPARLTALA
jgi:branched-chain amino acid aminotransferase